VLVYGYYYSLSLLAGAAIVTYLTSWYYALPFYLLTAFCLNFFRDPDRPIPAGPVAVSPADGKVISVGQQPDGGARVCIFMNVFDVHVNRTPIAGRVTCVTYKKGEFLVASKEEASDANEQNIMTVEGNVAGRPTRVVFKQIAGLVARRIICYKKAGDVVEAGERIGLIKFGSRVDVFFGAEWQVAVRVGERVSAASSVLARIKDA
jgi:phosphatidylserine decarboxylase